MQHIIFWTIYFGGLVSVFLLGMKIGYGLTKIKVSGNVCIDGFHHFVVDGSPNGRMKCKRCNFIEI